MTIAWPGISDARYAYEIHDGEVGIRVLEVGDPFGLAEDAVRLADNSCNRDHWSFIISGDSMKDELMTYMVGRRRIALLATSSCTGSTPVQNINQSI